MTFRALTLLLNISSIVQCKRTWGKKKKETPLLPTSHSSYSIQSPISSVLLHSELHEGSGLHLSFLNNVVFWGGKLEPAKVRQSPEQHQTHSSQYGSLHKSYAYSNMACVVNAVALHSSGC